MFNNLWLFCMRTKHMFSLLKLTYFCLRIQKLTLGNHFTGNRARTGSESAKQWFCNALSQFASLADHKVVDLADKWSICQISFLHTRLLLGLLSLDIETMSLRSSPLLGGSHLRVWKIIHSYAKLKIFNYFRR